mgnify:CR=1 FL=1
MLDNRDLSEQLYSAFHRHTGGQVQLVMHPYLALAILAACRYAVGHPQLCVHASSAVWYWTEDMEEQFEAITPGITDVVADHTAPRQWEAN